MPDLQPNCLMASRDAILIIPYYLLLGLNIDIAIIILSFMKLDNRFIIIIAVSDNTEITLL